MDRGWILVNFMVLGPLLGHVSAAVREFGRLRVSQLSSRHAQSILRENLHRSMYLTKKTFFKNLSEILVRKSEKS